MQHNVCNIVRRNVVRPAMLSKQHSSQCMGIDSSICSLDSINQFSCLGPANSVKFTLASETSFGTSAERATHTGHVHSGGGQHECQPRSQGHPMPEPTVEVCSNS